MYFNFAGGGQTCTQVARIYFYFLFVSHIPITREHRPDPDRGQAWLSSTVLQSIPEEHAMDGFDTPAVSTGRIIPLNSITIRISRATVFSSYNTAAHLFRDETTGSECVLDKDGMACTVGHVHKTPSVTRQQAASVFWTKIAWHAQLGMFTKH